ncbi:hypothetical protein NF27_DT00600 [Candidatus Jidaibacter acanthamoeba]|uniref:Uncharacterized protein n=1 Tax=Candidatus Jidaibacter acanthamoebae TaxID=86105 RepID=A0A0C1MZ51_9RICK|nr:hypothetical protein NF27_DT00600 [Candidatus Jidaibacter acanthamoeba]
MIVFIYPITFLEVKIVFAIYIKAKDRLNFYNIVLSITAYPRCKSQKFQQTLSLYNLDKTPFIFKLSNIPPKDLIIKDNQVFTLYDKVTIRLHALYEKENSSINLAEYVKEYNLNISHNNILNDNFVIRWQEYWNVNIIKEVKVELAEFYHYHLAAFPFILYKSLPDKIRRYCTHPLYLFLSNKYMLTLTFWLRNLIVAKQLRNKIYNSSF